MRGGGGNSSVLVIFMCSFTCFSNLAVVHHRSLITLCSAVCTVPDKMLADTCRAAWVNKSQSSPSLSVFTVSPLVTVRHDRQLSLACDKSPWKVTFHYVWPKQVRIRKEGPDKVLWELWSLKKESPSFCNCVTSNYNAETPFWSISSTIYITSEYTV